MANYTAPSELQNNEANDVHARMLAVLPPGIDRQQGGGAWDLTRPAATEISLAINDINVALQLAFPQYAFGEWLGLHAQVAGMARKAANAATGNVNVTGTDGTVIPAGFLFAVQSDDDSANLEFRTTESVTVASGVAALPVECTTPGEIGNVDAHGIRLMVSPLRGLTSIDNTSALTGGTEEESDSDPDAVLTLAARLKPALELCRFTASDTFNPADYPTIDGKYDVFLVGGGQGGTVNSNRGYKLGGNGGKARLLTELTLIESVTCTIGAGSTESGYNGGNALFGAYSAPGGGATTETGVEYTSRNPYDGRNYGGDGGDAIIIEEQASSTYTYYHIVGKTGANGGYSAIGAGGNGQSDMGGNNIDYCYNLAVTTVWAAVAVAWAYLKEAVLVAKVLS